MESESRSASYTSFMLDTINATIFKLILPYGYWPVVLGGIIFLPPVYGITNSEWYSIFHSI